MTVQSNYWSYSFEPVHVSNNLYGPYKQTDTKEIWCYSGHEVGRDGVRQKEKE